MGGREERDGRTRRAGSSWNRGNSAWAFGGREAQRARSPVRTAVAEAAHPSVSVDAPLPSTTKLETAAAGTNAAAAGTNANPAVRSNAGTTADPGVRLNVQKESGYFRVKGSVETAVGPDTLYGIITDYRSNARVFKNVERVEVEGRDNETIVTQFLKWNFLMWSGNYSVQMKMKDDPANRCVSYELAQPGFMKILNGSWKVEPLVTEGTSKLVLNQRALPSYFPPGPLAVGAGSYALKIMTNQVESLLSDLATEASEVRKTTGGSH